MGDWSLITAGGNHCGAPILEGNFTVIPNTSEGSTPRTQRLFVPTQSTCHRWAAECRYGRAHVSVVHSGKKTRHNLNEAARLPAFHSWKHDRAVSVRWLSHSSYTNELKLLASTGWPEKPSISWEESQLHAAWQGWWCIGEGGNGSNSITNTAPAWAAASWRPIHLILPADPRQWGYLHPQCVDDDPDTEMCTGVFFL